MTFLIVSLGTGKGTWAHVLKLVNSEEWEKIFFVCDPHFSGKFKTDKLHEFVEIDIKKSLKELSEQIRKKLDGKIADTEVALNLISGTGKEHMAILSAILKLGLGVRFIAWTGEKSEEL